jgi:large conductance mechanosensitive channel
MVWFEEFKAFIKRGNVLDLAVAVIIGAAFTKIVNSLVSDMIMPLIGIATQSINLATLHYELFLPGDPQKPAADLKYGSFLQAGIDFLIVAFCVFWLVKLINALHQSKVEDPKPVELTTQEKLLTEIRDLLKNQKPPA